MNDLPFLWLAISAIGILLQIVIIRYAVLLALRDARHEDRVERLAPDQAAEFLSAKHHKFLMRRKAQ
ncbi:hypothetical protein AB0O87_02765 [Microbacterium sp. NPDC076768]|uniref:hypothetical protein n=1 Tax=Microbacterium sp. NPDC076768 TaxID=3154858 RepID=UPI0034205D7E